MVQYLSSVNYNAEDFSLLIRQTDPEKSVLCLILRNNIYFRETFIPIYLCFALPFCLLVSFSFTRAPSVSLRSCMGPMSKQQTVPSVCLNQYFTHLFLIFIHLCCCQMPASSSVAWPSFHLHFTMWREFIPFLMHHTVLILRFS